MSGMHAWWSRAAATGRPRPGGGFPAVREDARAVDRRLRDRRPGGERGSVAVEVAVLAPAFLGLIVLAGVAGRTAIAQEAVESAAHDAARAASIARDAATARTSASAAARGQLDWQRANCVDQPTVTLTGSAGGDPIDFDDAYTSATGTPTSVTVVVSCTVSFSDIHLSLLPGMPDGRTVSATFTSPLDRYRSRP
ncbi:TadE/TadG family type IV pilus assembly protein [Micromonospora okii]|uniref:TadE/TadG family type IV pilus assembly protein n=1 Tax=Micromonospora okii TaxID=1182970 RepID=UPI001E407C56|nr:TadE/TadG family type IV pilus assembly protein [Micromonospora okii]